MKANPLDEKAKFEELEKKYARKKPVVQEEDEAPKFDSSVANPPTPTPY